MITSCHTTYNSSRSSNLTNENELMEILYFIESDSTGIKPIKLEEKQRPIPVQGKDRWIRDFYGSLRYPATARDKGIGGIVVLRVKVNDNGTVTDVRVKKGIYKECDEEAMRAFIFSTQDGYNPLVFKGRPISFIMEMPVKFRLL